VQNNRASGVREGEAMMSAILLDLSTVVDLRNVSYSCRSNSEHMRRI